MFASSVSQAPFRPRAMLVIVLLGAQAAVGAQHPMLAPTSDTTIVVPSGVLRYSSIQIPVGVTVRFVALGFGPLSVAGMPAVVLCDGDATVRGTIWLAGDSINDRPAGWVTTGRGADGFLCGSGGLSQPPGGGRHRGSYGSELPFSLEGGSPGGDRLNFVDPLCFQSSHYTYGGEGGGTLVLLAGGRIDVHGTITADGQGGYAGGSGGSILLRGGRGVTVHPGATISALGGQAPAAPPPYAPLFSTGEPGYVRIDAWGAPPDIRSAIYPAPTVLELPHLRQQSPPRIGTTWVLDVFAPDSTPVFLAASLTPGNGAPTPFGALGVDLVTAASVAFTVAQPGHDPVASVPWPIPNSPALVGLSVWLQALAVPNGLPARLTNTLPVVVQ